MTFVTSTVSLLICVVTPCGLADRHQSFGGTYCLHLEGRQKGIILINGRLILSNGLICVGAFDLKTEADPAPETQSSVCRI
jgi:hypothetical protein